MSRPNRTVKQTTADEVDRALYHLATAVEALSELVNDAEIDELSRRLFGSRGCIRRHMHADDRIDTGG